MNANGDVQWSWQKVIEHVQTEVNFLVDNKQLDGSCVIVETSYIFWCKQPKKVSRISLWKPKKLSVELEIHVKKYVTVCRGECLSKSKWLKCSFYYKKASNFFDLIKILIQFSKFCIELPRDFSFSWSYFIL